MKGKRKMKQTIQKCLHWIASDARQTKADVKRELKVYLFITF